MQPIPTMLVVTTDKDISTKLFSRPEAVTQIEPTFITYTASSVQFSEALNSPYQYVYFRDPFNDFAISQSAIGTITKHIVQQLPEASYVDSIRSLNDMLFEDKWLQYNHFSKLMPATEIVQSFSQLDINTHFVKRRISSRARGVILSTTDIPAGAQPTDYITQPKLKIITEYRIFMIGGEIILPLAIKSSKTISQKVKVLDTTTDVAPEIMAICQAVGQRVSFDFIGLDIAKTTTGYYLLEVNRSPQFMGYDRITGTNLAASLNAYLRAKT